MGGFNIIFSFDPNTSGKYTEVARLPVNGNGLAFHNATGLLYSTNEGSVTSLGSGTIHKSNPVTGEVTLFDKNVFTADGAIIDQVNNLLYVSEVLTAHIRIYDLNTGSMINRYQIPNAVSLDDMCLSNGNTQLIGADFRNGSIARWPANGKNLYNSIQVWDLKSPTSVRLAFGPGFNTGDIFITEGGGLTKFQTNRYTVERIPSSPVQ